MRDRLAVRTLTRWSGWSSPPPTRRTFFVSLTALKKRMPPRKAPVQEKKVLLGRPSNNLKIGIVGAFLPMPFRPPSKTFVLTQVFPTLASHLSSTSCPKQVTTFLSHPTACRTNPRFFLDLGKAANFPYATIDPEAGRPVHHLAQQLKYMP
jgi:hypothetical protein